MLKELLMRENKIHFALKRKQKDANKISRD